MHSEVPQGTPTVATQANDDDISRLVDIVQTQMSNMKLMRSQMKEIMTALKLNKTLKNKLDLQQPQILELQRVFQSVLMKLQVANQQSLVHSKLIARLEQRVDDNSAAIASINKTLRQARRSVSISVGEAPFSDRRGQASLNSLDVEDLQELDPIPWCELFRLFGIKSKGTEKRNSRRKPQSPSSPLPEENRSAWNVFLERCLCIPMDVENSI